MVGGGIENKGESLIVKSTVDVQVFSFPRFFFFPKKWSAWAVGELLNMLSL